MAPTNGYCTTAELKARLWPYGVTPDAYDDTIFDQVVTAVSRWIDRFCGRRFYTSAEDETRYFTAVDASELLGGDLVSVTSLATDEDGDRTYERTWAATDYDLLPANASLEGLPYWMIGVTPNGNYVFPVNLRKAVKIVGKWGFSSCPADVKEACLLQCERIYKRKDAPFGVVGSPEAGGEMRLIQKLDPDVAAMLAGWVKYG